VSIDAFQPDFDVLLLEHLHRAELAAGPDGNGDPKQPIGKNGDNDTVGRLP